MTFITFHIKYYRARAGRSRKLLTLGAGAPWGKQQDPETLQKNWKQEPQKICGSCTGS